jgi:hypothetical protein
MKKMTLVLGVIGVLMTLSICAVAGISNDVGVFEVVFLGNAYCVSQTGSYCEVDTPGIWGGTAAGYISLFDPNGTLDAYLWTDGDSDIWFASGDKIVPPPAGLPYLGSMTEDGSLQTVTQFWPGGWDSRLLQVESPVGTTPEPSTLLLVGPAAAFLLSRIRRFGRG